MLPVNRFYNDRDSYKTFGIQLEGLSLKNFNSFQPHFHKLADKNCKKYMTIYTICDSVGPANPLGPLELALQDFFKGLFDFNDTKFNAWTCHRSNFNFVLIMFSRLCTRTCSREPRNLQFDSFFDLLIPIAVNLYTVLTSELQLL